MNARRSGRSLLRERFFLMTALMPPKMYPLLFFVGTSGVSRAESDNVDPLSMLMVSAAFPGRRPEDLLMDVMEDMKLPPFGGGVGCGEGGVSNNNNDQVYG